METPARFTGAEAHLRDLASTITGLTDFGDDEHLEGLGVLLRAVDSDLKPTPFGRQLVWGAILGVLIARLHTQEGWRQRPDCLSTTIRHPLVITGIPRTGTTALHKLLAIDPQFQGLEHWLTEAPMPRPAKELWSANPHYRRSVTNLDAYFSAVPEMRAAHDIVADEVDECLEVLKQSFVSNWLPSSFGVPSYDAWLQTRDERASYRRYADVLRLIGSDEPDKRWLLKNPGHIAQLDALLDVFPDACIVQTHRDPVQAIPSVCSILAMSRRAVEGDGIDRAAIGRRESAYWHRAAAHAEQVRDRFPDRVFDVDHRRFHAEPLAVVQDIYARFDLVLKNEVREGMRDWIAASPTTRHGRHDYSLSGFGLSPRTLSETFAAYNRRHGLAVREPENRPTP